MYVVLWNEKVVGEYESRDDANEAQYELELLGIPASSIKVEKRENEDN